MKKTWWIFFVLLVVCVANANAAVGANVNGIYNYGYWVPALIHDYLDQVDRNSPREGGPQCQNVYSTALDKGVIDIRYALGYFDDTTGEEKIYEGINYGISPSLDIEVFKAFVGQMTSPCRTRSLRSCGFSKSGDVNQGKVLLQKNITLQGKKVLVNMTVTQASATDSFAQNKGPQSARQSLLTQQSEEAYFNGLKVADVVLYNGHSRNGGGPDFNPPVLMANKHVNYNGYYRVKRPGITRMLASLKENPNKGVIIGMFSCYSRLHFQQMFLAQNPKQRMVLSAETIDYFDAIKASVGYLEGFLRGSCGQELADTAKQDEKLKSGFQGYNIN